MAEAGAELVVAHQGLQTMDVQILFVVVWAEPIATVLAVVTVITESVVNVIVKQVVERLSTDIAQDRVGDVLSLISLKAIS